MNVSLWQLLQEMKSYKASDLHVKQGAKPFYRVNGALTPIKREPVTQDEITEFLSKVMPEKLRDEWETHGAVDFAFSVDRDLRFRTNAYYQRGMVSIAMRLLEHSALTFEELGLPKVMYQLADMRRGIILFTGPTGTGKTTSMAAMINYINDTRREHIITIEDPIEFVFKDNKSVVDQREVGVDTSSFDMSLRHAMRQDPDVILVGEMRDTDTITNAIRAGLTGHLVISTLHTINASMTVNRIIQYYPPAQQESVRADLAITLRAVLSQRLIKSSDGNKRAPIVEVMVVNSIVQKLIREDRIADVKQVIQNRLDGMQSFDQSLVDLVKRRIISANEGEYYCEDLQAYRRNIKGEYAAGDQQSILGSQR